MAKINLDLQKEVQQLLNEYGDSVFKAAREATEEVTKGAVKKLRQDSPKRSGRYARHWRHKYEQTRGGNVKIIIYNVDPTYRLAHLLEFGHALRNGGRVAGTEHIKPVEDWAAEEIVKETERRLLL